MKFLRRPKLRKIFKPVAVIALALGITVSSTTPSQAFAPAIFLVPQVATTIATVAGASVAVVSGTGELALLGLGAYMAWTSIAQTMRITAKKHTGSNTDPISTPFSTAVNSGYTMNTYKSFNLAKQNVTRGLVLGFSNFTFNVVGGTLTTGTPTYATTTSTELFDQTLGTTGIRCGIITLNTGTNVLTNQSPIVTETDSVTIPNNTATTQDVNCRNAIQTMLTTAGVNNTTIVLQSVYVMSHWTMSAISENYASGTLGPNLQQSPLVEHTLLSGAVSIYGTTICKNASGTTLTLANTPVDMVDGVQDVAVKPCPDGYYVYDTQIFSSDAVVPQKLIDIGQNPAKVSTYPLCMGIDKCQLQVYYKTVPCTDSVGACTDWYKDYILAPADYQCYWGTYLLSGMSDCAPLIYQYDPNAVRNAQGLATKSNIVAPPSNDTTQTATSVQTDSGFLGCAPSGWNLLNPLAYVGMNGCILQWAFIPKADEFATATSTISTAWNASSVGTFVDAIVAVPASLPLFAGSGATGCGGVTFSMPMHGAGADTSQTLLNSCSGDTQTMANLSHLVLSILTVFGGAVLVYRPIQEALGLPKIGGGDNGSA